MKFRKRKHQAADGALDDTAPGAEATAAAGTAAATAPAPGADPDPATAADAGEAAVPEVADYDRAAGPWDSGEVDEPGEGTLDLGCVRVPMISGLEVRVEVEPEGNQPIAVTLVHGDAAVQVRVFSAPRSGGLWAEAAHDLRTQLASAGPDAYVETVGPFGTELRAVMLGQDEQGNQLQQPVRFIGVDGPRWMLQGVLLGAGANPDTAAGIEDTFRALVVVRGDTAMPKGRPLPIVLPAGAVPQE